MQLGMIRGNLVVLETRVLGLYCTVMLATVWDWWILSSGIIVVIK